MVQVLCKSFDIALKNYKYDCDLDINSKNVTVHEHLIYESKNDDYNISIIYLSCEDVINWIDKYLEMVIINYSYAIINDLIVEDHKVYNVFEFRFFDN